MKGIILLPTYNERENICRIIPDIFSVIPDIKVMVVDDNSPDGTADEVISLQQKFSNLFLYKREKKEGLGKAYMDAFAKSIREHDVDFIFTMDADLSHDPKYLPLMVERVKNNDYVIGSRYTSGGTIVGWELWRRVLSAWGNFYCRSITRMKIKDCTSGFGCIRVKLLNHIDFSDFDSSGYAFLMYLKFKAWQHGARISEIPICFKNRETGESKISMNIIQEGLLLPWRLIQKRKNNAIPSTNCITCNSKETSFWFTKNKANVHRCKNCRLIFVYPIPEATSEIYSDNYFCGATDGFGYINYEQDKIAGANVFTKYLSFIFQYRPQKGRLLDVGSATGAFVQAANEANWEAIGVEISDYAASEGRKKGLDIRTGIIETCGFDENSFDVITMLDVFEHLPNPVETLSHIKKLLRPGGLFVINIPDAGSAYARIMGKRWPLIIPPEHIHLFNINNLEMILDRGDFSIVTKHKIGKKFRPAYIFQILYTVRHQKIWKVISTKIRNTPLNSFEIPIHLRDNMFVISRKK